MLRVVAIDDEPLALRQLVAYINRVPELTLVARCQSAVEAAGVLSREQVDAIFCDINMPDLSGLDLVRSLRNGGEAPLVVFTTAYSQYALEGFEVAAVDYLLKPFSINDFQRAVNRLTERKQQQAALAEAKSQTAAESTAAEEVVYIRADHRTHALPLRDIRYVQAMGEYLRVYVGSQPRPLTALLSMKRMSELLPADRFLRIHRSYFINVNRIAHFAKGRVTLTDGTELPIGDSYRAAFEERVRK